MNVIEGNAFFEIAAAEYKKGLVGGDAVVVVGENMLDLGTDRNAELRAFGGRAHGPGSVNSDIDVDQRKGGDRTDDSYKREPVNPWAPVPVLGVEAFSSVARERCGNQRRRSMHTEPTFEEGVVAVARLLLFEAKIIFLKFGLNLDLK